MADQKLSNDFQFRDVPRQDPAKKPMVMRTEDFVEIYETFQPKEATHQAHRCLNVVTPTASGSVRYTTTSLTGSSWSAKATSWKPRS